MEQENNQNNIHNEKPQPLRLNDIIPSGKLDQNSNPEIIELEENEVSYLDAEQQAKPDANQQEDNSAKTPVENQTSRSERNIKIPSFDLTQKIMAQQRMETSRTRKGPGGSGFEKQKAPSVKESKPTQADAQAVPAPISPKHKIIRDIVARDIQRMLQKH